MTRVKIKKLSIHNFISFIDEEWDFEVKHGTRESWSGTNCRAHERLLSRIQRSRSRVNDLMRAAIGRVDIDV